jgi:hypothetical protein
MAHLKNRAGLAHRQDAVVPDDDLTHVDLGSDGSSGSGLLATGGGGGGGKSALAALDRLQSPRHQRLLRVCGLPYSRRRMGVYSLLAGVLFCVMYAVTLSRVRCREALRSRLSRRERSIRSLFSPVTCWVGGHRCTLAQALVPHTRMFRPRLWCHLSVYVRACACAGHRFVWASAVLTVARRTFSAPLSSA